MNVDKFMNGFAMCCCSVFFWFTAWEALDCSYYLLLCVLLPLAAATGIWGQVRILRSIGVNV